MKKLKNIFEFLKATKSFLKAVFGKKSSFEVFLFRLNKCNDCSWNVVKDNKHYCKGCMCPKSKLWPFAELRRKANYFYAPCPRNKWNIEKDKE